MNYSLKADYTELSNRKQLYYNTHSVRMTSKTFYQNFVNDFYFLAYTLST